MRYTLIIRFELDGRIHSEVRTITNKEMTGEFIYWATRPKCKIIYMEWKLIT